MTKTKTKTSWGRAKAWIRAKAKVQKIPKPRPWTTRPYFVEPAARNISGIPDERCFVLQNAILALRDVPGEIAECGVRYGKSAAFMHAADGKDRMICLFDSFEGLSEPQAEDVMPELGKTHWTAHDFTVPEHAVRANLQGLNRMQYFKGWIPERFPDVADRRFALLHVDVDLYQPTRDALEFFWPLLSPGGMVVCDDYGAADCPGAKLALDEFFADGRGRLMELPTMQAMVIKPG